MSSVASYTTEVWDMVCLMKSITNCRSITVYDAVLIGAGSPSQWEGGHKDLR